MTWGWERVPLPEETPPVGPQVFSALIQGAISPIKHCKHMLIDLQLIIITGEVLISWFDDHLATHIRAQIYHNKHGDNHDYTLYQ